MIDSMGFVPMREIQNVFSEALKKMDEDYRRLGPPTDYRTIIEHVEDIRSELIKRAEFNIKTFLTKNPEMRKKEHDVKKEAEAEAPRKKSWEDRVQAQKRDAIKAALEG